MATPMALKPAIQLIAGFYLYYIYYAWLFVELLLVFSSDGSVEVTRPRGVPLSKKSFYRPDTQFTCIDGSNTMPFSFVNDDYCDCADGTDEPGTAACSNGAFHCSNHGHVPKDILSHMVNDNICDCCDGSDEWSSDASCQNTCQEEGRKVREEAQQLVDILNEGYSRRTDLVNEGRKALDNHQAQLTSLKKQVEELREKLSTLEDEKNKAELPEKEAKEKHEAWWEEEKARKKAEKDLISSKAAFDDLDVNKDSKVTRDELLTRAEFDVDNSGVVTEDELGELLGDETDAYDLDGFRSRIWDEIRDVYQAVPDPAAAAEDSKIEEDGDQVETHPDDEEYTDEDLEGLDDEDDFVDDPDAPTPPATEAPPGYKLTPPPPTAKEDTPMPDYDEATKLLIQAATDARTAYNDAHDAITQLEADAREHERSLTLDAGEEAVFLPMNQQCYELTDREYTYKLCMFGSVTQRPKNGGGETQLGTFSLGG